MEVEAVTHALRWIASRCNSQTTHATILADSMSLLQKVEREAQTGVCKISTFTFENSCGCTALDMPEWKETTEQIDWRAKQPSQVTYISENLKCWEAWDTTCGHKAKDITPSIAWRRGVERESARWSSLKGREGAIVNQKNIGTVSKATSGKRLRKGVERIWIFPSA